MLAASCPLSFGLAQGALWTLAAQGNTGNQSSSGDKAASPMLPRYGDELHLDDRAQASPEAEAQDHFYAVPSLVAYIAIGRVPAIWEA